MFSADDRAHMRSALALGRRGLGNTAPNPAVGCVLVRYDLNPTGRVVGRGWTQPGGRPHAETEAIRRAGDLAQGAHAYVTLEPCNHTGKTGPCSEALIAAGVSAVTIALEDVDERVAGQGAKRLREAGLDVRLGLLEDEARALNAGFFSTKERARPWVTLKTATTLDAAIATRINNESKWITGPRARQHGHLLRAQNDAIMTGIGTVLEDDPELTCRLPGLRERSPLRIVVDIGAGLPVTSKLVKSAKDHPVCILVSENDNEAKVNRLEDAGVIVVKVRTISPVRFDYKDMLTAVANLGVTRLLVEAGAGLSGTFFSADAVDELVWYRAPIMFGDLSPRPVPLLNIETPSEAPRYKRVELLELDDDVMERYLRVRD